MENPLELILTEKQEEYKKDVITAFVESCIKAGMKANIIEYLTPIIETAFMEGVLCERINNVDVLLNHENYN